MKNKVQELYSGHLWYVPCNKVYEAVCRQTVMIGDGGMEWRDIGNRLVKVS